MKRSDEPLYLSAREAAGELVVMLARRLLAAKARVERGGALDEPHAD